jgi:hypothetical protein
VLRCGNGNTCCRHDEDQAELNTELRHDGSPLPLWAVALHCPFFVRRSPSPSVVSAIKCDGARCEIYPGCAASMRLCSRATPGLAPKLLCTLSGLPLIHVG